ncbi:unnamed protein product [Arctogadus glacialis]
MKGCGFVDRVHFASTPHQQKGYGGIHTSFMQIHGLFFCRQLPTLHMVFHETIRYSLSRGGVPSVLPLFPYRRASTSWSLQNRDRLTFSSRASRDSPH